MGLTDSDVEEFISRLHQDAGLRERVRQAILADDFSPSPGSCAAWGNALMT
jgi:hypothetical protein